VTARPISVLILDDEAEIRQVLADYLVDEGRFRVRDVATSTEALVVLESGGVDVCLVDLRLPGSDGFAFLQEARARHPSVKFLIHTGSHEADVREQARVAGIPDDRILLKPVRLESILRALDKAVGG
jgi:two-component system, OmpR family, response regulator